MNKLVRIMFLSALLLVMTVSAAFASGVKDRSAAEISTAHYTDPSFDLSYPQVTMKDKKAEEKINSRIEAEVAHFKAGVKADMQQGGKIQATMKYEVKMNRMGLLSLTLSEYTYADRAAHGMTYVKGMTFNTEGQLCTYGDVLKLAAAAKSEDGYTASAVTEKLKAKAAQEGFMLNSDFKGLDKVTQEFYFDNNTDIHILFQPYEVAPYAVGVIDLKMM